jgi:hypothetical protein
MRRRWSSGDGQNSLTTAVVKAEGLYDVTINAISPALRTEEEVGQAAREGGSGAKGHNAARTHLTELILSYI